MPVSRLKTISAVFLGLILATSAVGFLGHAKVAADPQASAGATASPPDAGAGLPGQDRPTGTDRYGDPLPAGALARLGTVRFRHGWSVDRLTFSPDGKLVASWDCFRGIVLWDVSSGRVVRELPAGIDARSFGFSPDGKTLAVPHGTAGGFVIGLFDVASGRELRPFKGERTNFAALTFSHNGKLLAGAEYSKHLRLWEVDTGRERHPLRKGGDGEFQFFQDIAFSPDDAIMASAYGDGPIVLWKVSTRELLRQLKGHQGPVSFVRFSPDGKTLISAGQDAVRRWEVATGKEVAVFAEKPEQVCLSRDGKLLASSSAGGLIRLWDVPTGKPIRQWRDSIPEVRALAFSPDGKRLASGGWHSAIHFWDVETGKEVPARGTHQGTIRALAFDQAGALLLAASGDAVICQWDLATQSPRRSALYDGSKPAFAIAFAPDRKSFATWESDSGIRIHDLTTGKVIQALRQHGPAGPSRLAYAPDGKTLASAGQDLVVRLWDTATGKELRQFHGPKVWIACLAISPDGRLLAAADSRETERIHKVHLWDLATGTEMAQLERESVIESIAFSLDGRVLASAGRGPWIELWEVQSGKRIRKMEWLESKREWHMTQGGTPQLAFSNDGRLLASGGAGKRNEDYSIRVWNSITGQQVYRFEGHPTSVSQLVFSPDDKTLVSGGTDSTIVLWDVAVRQPKREIDGPPLSPKALNALWDDLVGQDAARAYQAIWSLAASPGQSVPFLRGHLRPVAAVDRKKIERLILDLDSSRFAVRDRARSELEQLGPAAEAAIREHLAGKRPSLESRRRLELILDKLNPAHSPEMLRILRAVAALEYSLSLKARSLLQELAKGSPHARLTQDAKAALERLGRQPASQSGKSR
ncbi:MAG: WD40 repeat domain-containing protein [Planctomycetes bacterium]|nr:WD40 repeat domain-containing protein [Planctomycetota bacterium]